jgi:tetratricopeptide (TPR) repeat protein
MTGVRSSFRHVSFRSAAVRYLTWRLVQPVGRVGRFMFSGRRKTVPLLVLTELGAFGLYAVHVGRDDILDPYALVVAAYGFLAWLALVFVVLLVNARSRVVVEPFTDATGDAQKAEPRGLATLLVSEIAELRDLYSAVDQRAIPTAVQKTRPLDATIKVEDLNDFLEGPAMIESKASIGPIQIPMGALLAFLGRFVRGPRLLGGVHVEGTSLVLAAQLSRQGSLPTWRVERPLRNKSGTRIQVPHEMVEELAYRMFTDLAVGDPVRWRATKLFADALRAIRVCLRTPENRRQNLQEAERLLIEAQNEDDQLSFVYYNLGVVFTELRRQAETERSRIEPRDWRERQRADDEVRNYWNAAERAFGKQIELMPDRWEAYYALALTYECREPTPQWDYVLKRCDRVTAMNPGPATRAKALLVKSSANESRREDPRQRKRMILHRQWAVAEAWAALCRKELVEGGDTASERQLAASALKALARGYRKTRPRRRSLFLARRLLRRAVKLSPHDPEIWFELARASESKPSRAIRCIDEALRIDPGRGDYWARLALVHAKYANALSGDVATAEREHATYCAKQALRLLDCDRDEPSVDKRLSVVADAYRALGSNGVQEGRVRAMREVAGHCAALAETKSDLEAASIRTVLEDLLDRHGGADWGWGRAQQAIAVGRFEFAAARREAKGGARTSRYETAAASFKSAIEALAKDEDFDEIVRRNLRILHAEALQKQGGKNDDALDELRRAIGDDPLHSRPREALAEAYLAIRDYEQALRVLHQALLWEPDSAALYRKLGRCHWILATDRRRATRRKRALRRAIAAFRRAQDLSGHHALQTQLETHYWLARLHKELGEYELAIPYLRRATTCSGAEPLVRLLLGEAYVRSHAYDSADIQLKKAIDSAAGAAETDYGVHFNDAGWEADRVVAQAHALRAFAYAERGVKLREATLAVRRGKEAARNVSLERHEADAALDFAAGLIALKQDGDTIKKAIRRFRRSLAASPQSETYVSLALAYLLDSDADPANAARSLRRGEDACWRAIELDVTEQYSARAKTLLDALAAARGRVDPKAAKVPAAAGKAISNIRLKTAPWLPAHDHVDLVMLSDGAVLTRAQVISRIRSGERFSTNAIPPGLVYVHPCPHCKASDYVTTHPDATPTNDLLHLPVF